MTEPEKSGLDVIRLKKLLDEVEIYNQDLFYHEQGQCNRYCWICQELA